MASHGRAALRAMEGCRVCIALRDGSRLDDCQLVSAGRHSTSTVWLFANGRDAFVNSGDVIDCWEAP